MMGIPIPSHNRSLHRSKTLKTVDSKRIHKQRFENHPSPLQSAFFQCDVCGKNEAVFSNAGRLEEPSRCGNCHNGFTMRLIHNRSRFSDKQMVKMQGEGGENRFCRQTTCSSA